VIQGRSASSVAVFLRLCYSHSTHISHFYVPRSTHNIAQQTDRRSLLDAQEQEESRAQDRAKEILGQTPETRRLQGGKEIGYNSLVALGD
jgi:hypothetical protein